MPGHSRTKKPDKRRLVGLRVDEVSLVDNPAVPEASFLVVKRDDVAPVSGAQLPAGLPENLTLGAPVMQPPTEEGGSWTVVYPVKNSEELSVSIEESTHSESVQPDANTVEIPAETTQETTDTTETVGAAGATPEESTETADPVEVEKASRVFGPKQFAAIEQAVAMLGEALKAAKKITKGDEPDTDETPETEPTKEVAKADEPPQPSALDSAGAILKQKAIEKQAAEDRAVIETMGRVSVKLNETLERVGGLTERVERLSGKAS